jgi:hypothetical protein
MATRRIDLMYPVIVKKEKSTEQLSEEISKQTMAFLSKGGTITPCHDGETAIDYYAPKRNLGAEANRRNRKDKKPSREESIMDTDKRIAIDGIVYRVPGGTCLGDAIQEQYPPTGKVEGKPAYKTYHIDTQEKMDNIDKNAVSVNPVVNTSHLDPDSRD